jgi:amidase
MLPSARSGKRVRGGEEGAMSGDERHEEPWRLDAVELAGRIRMGRLTARAAVESALERLHAVNPAINAVVRTMDDEALAAADEADGALRAGGALGPLHGVPVTTKINTDQQGHPTDNGCVAFRDQIAPGDAAVVAHLRRAGAIFIGRTNAPPFSMRWFTSNELHGRTLNPWDSAVTPGGSSGGAGAAVAAGIGTISQGNDIGGSVRYPAYANGIVGLRPTIGRIASTSTLNPPGRGLGSAQWATQGPLARTIRDCRLAFEVMAARDLGDTRWVDVPLDGPPAARPIRVALVAEPEGKAIDPAVAEAIRAAGRYLADAGYAVEETVPPELDRAAELWHQLAKVDTFAGLRPRMEEYGDEDSKRSLELWCDLQPTLDLEGFVRGHTERDALVTRWAGFLEEYPVVVMPSSGEPPLPVDVDIAGPEGARRGFEANRFQLAIALLALPGLSVRVGQAGGLPLGVQLVAARFREELLFEAGAVIEAREGVRTPIDPVGAA